MKAKKPRIPQLRRHQTGNYFCRWGGHDYYFGKDEGEAEAQYLESLKRWREWKEDRQRYRLRPTARVPLVVDLVEQFTKAQGAENGYSAKRYYTYHLKTFATLYGQFPADIIGPRHLNAMKLDRLQNGYAPRTINHDMTAVRVMYNWASGLELVRPISLKGVKNLPLGPVQHRTYSQEHVWSAIIAAPEKVRPWLAINYLGLMRPSEVVRLVNGQGEWTHEGVFQLDRGKMDRKVTLKRHVILSPLAMAWLKCAEPHWSRLDSYGQFCRLHKVRMNPKQFQKAGSDHLVNFYDADPADVEMLLGHVPARMRVTYFQKRLPRLLETSSLLGLRSVYA